MNIIASADRNWGIGRGSRLLVRIPDDLHFFRQMTIGKVVVMGRKTRESIPGGILDSRTNIVLTHDCGYQAAGIRTVHSLWELQEELRQYPGEDIFLAGGGSIYRQLLDFCDRAYITKIDAAFDADIYMPNLDERPEWKLEEQGAEQFYSGMIYHFCRYGRREAKMARQGGSIYGRMPDSK